MTIADHAGDSEQQLATMLHKRQQVRTQVPGVAAEIVIGVDAHHGVEEAGREGKRGGIRLDWHDLAARKPNALEEAHVIGRIAPEVSGEHGEAALAPSARS